MPCSFFSAHWQGLTLCELGSYIFSLLALPARKLGALQSVRIHVVAHASEDGEALAVCTAMEAIRLYEAFGLKQHIGFSWGTLSLVMGRGWFG